MYCLWFAPIHATRYLQLSSPRQVNLPLQVGFLAEPRRLNVAITRARRHLAIVADCDTLAADPFLSRVAEYFSSCGEHRDAAEYGALPAVHFKKQPGANKTKQAKKPKAERNSTHTNDRPRQDSSKGAKPAPELTSPEEADHQRTEIEERIVKWEKAGSELLEFDSDLSSFGRRLVHEVVSAAVYVRL